MYVIAQFNLFSKILIFIHKENPVNQKKSWMTSRKIPILEESALLFSKYVNILKD